MLDRAAGEALLVKLDEFAGELARFRAELVTHMPPAEGNGADEADDLADANLLDTHSAAARFGFARDTISKMCRDVDGIGVWKGGRWQVRIAALRRHLERKNNQ